MKTTHLSFRFAPDLADQTNEMAKLKRMTRAAYVREAVREKNERSLRERMVYLSKQLRQSHPGESQAMETASRTTT